MSAKNWLLWPSLMILLMHYAFAQPMPNSIVVGGSVHGNLSYGVRPISYRATFSPTLGLQVGKLGFGTKMDIGVSSFQPFNSYRVMAGLWSRYYFTDQKKLTPFAEVAMSQGFTKSKGSPFDPISSVSATYGYAWFPTKTLAVTTGFSFYYNRVTSQGITQSAYILEPYASRSGLSLNVGLTGFIPRKKK